MMRQMNKKKFYFFNKLVGDNVYELFKADNSTISTRILQDDTEYKKALYKKILEEVEEFFTATNREEIIEEYVDVQNVLSGVYTLYNISPEEIEIAHQRKQKSRGSYAKRLFLSVVACNEGSYAHKGALRNGYPEITQEEFEAYCTADKEHQIEENK